MKERLKNINKGNFAMVVVIILIVAIIGYEIFSVTHIELKTQTATVTTVYDKITADALVIRQESVVSSNATGVTVPCVDDGDKVAVGGNVAMVFSSEKEATDYSKFTEIQQQIEYYQNLGSQTVGQASGLETVNKDIEQKVIDYAYSTRNNSIVNEDQELNSVLIRRQMIIGENVDLTSQIEELGERASQYSGSKPNSYITTKQSGVFSSYTDGYENIIPFDDAKETTIEQFNSVLASIDESTNASSNSSNFGKLITGYDWYIQTVVSAEDVQDLKNGDSIEIALNGDQNKTLNATIVDGADPNYGETETLLILQCNVLDDSIAKLRKTEIEIRKKSYEGFKVPYEALHVVDGEKGVYVLIASQVKFRQVSVIYSDDENVIVEYDSSNTNGIHLYDKIIIQGKDLEDGKVYT